MCASHPSLSLSYTGGCCCICSSGRWLDWRPPGPCWRASPAAARQTPEEEQLDLKVEFQGQERDRPTPHYKTYYLLITHSSPTLTDSLPTGYWHHTAHNLLLFFQLLYILTLPTHYPLFIFLHPHLILTHQSTNHLSSAPFTRTSHSLPTLHLFSHSPTLASLTISEEGIDDSGQGGELDGFLSSLQLLCLQHPTEVHWHPPLPAWSAHRCTNK